MNTVVKTSQRNICTHYQYLSGLILTESVRYEGLIPLVPLRIYDDILKELLSVTEVQNHAEEEISDVSTISVVHCTVESTKLPRQLFSAFCEAPESRKEQSTRTVVLNLGSWYPLGVPNAVPGGTGSEKG